MDDITLLAPWGGPTATSPDTEIPVSSMNFALSLGGPVSAGFTPVVPVQQCQLFVQGTGVVVQVLDNNGNPINIRTATTLEILVTRPNGVQVAVPAAFYTNGLDGQMVFTTSATVPANTGIDQVGTWSIHGKVVLGGELQYTGVSYFEVFANLGV